MSLVAVFIVVALLAGTMLAVVILARRNAEVARELVQAAIPIELAMMWALIATMAVQR